MTDKGETVREAENRPYRLGVGVVLMNGAGRVFVGQRIDMAGDAWQMPQGGLDAGEEPRVAALRELEEEIGTDKAEIIAETRTWVIYDLPPDLAEKAWGGRFRGQKQKWFVARFTGTDADIDIRTDRPEFRAWRWARPETLPELIVPFKRRLYLDVLGAFPEFFPAFAPTRKP